ncbi:TIGR00282 family metallophosphoesterase [Lactiplantibacillus garii]|uniref:TIGR00282 family metallophosphoesterase n=1 Tax=Lactiplantibacillus garii TaxID=2306423 RepID=A0A3R8KJM9_9LACO|nr:TIGR00282 family metallophosphoesterase [Lactiplantibacillus garii]RRK11122.1 TIGR00282 family metallophosphoesterase [Lactiplantibacillus garii]
MRILFVGDVMGNVGQTAVATYLPKLKRRYKPQVTIVNGENATRGRGISQEVYKDFLSAGADVITMGNHTWDNNEIFDFIGGAKKLVRPLNFPPATTPGQGYTVVKVNTVKLAVINLQGNVFMGQNLADPFTTVQPLIAELRQTTPNIFIDFHAETTSEKEALAWYLDGQVSAVVGTHTHVQTSDERVLPQGTAFLSDVGFTGPYNGILGMTRENVIQRFLEQMPTRFNVQEDSPAVLSGCVIDVNEKTGHAQKIQRILINPDHPYFDD